MRRYTRTQVRVPATCIFEDQTCLSVVILDVSLGGFRLDTSVPIAVGEEMIIYIDQIGRFRCRLAWKENTQCGVQLLEEANHLSVSQITELASSLQNI